jgi:calcium-dependent protein kinase
MATFTPVSSTPRKWGSASRSNTGSVDGKPGLSLPFPSPRKERKGGLSLGVKNFETKGTKEAFEEQYEILEFLGEGAFGLVHVGLHKESGNRRAVKDLSKLAMNLHDERLTRTEIAVLKGLDHPNILQLYYVYETEESFKLVTDLVTGSTLATYLDERGDEQRFGTLTEPQTARLMRQILSCVNYCHSHNVVHRDLSTANVMLEKDCSFDRVKVIDFGYGIHAAPYEKLSDMAGTPDYTAPQVIEGEYTSKCDIWSCGVMTYEILSGRMPFSNILDEERNDQATIDNILCENYSFEEDPQWENISDVAKDFVKYLLTYDEKERPSASQALRHPFILKYAENRKTDASAARAYLDSMAKFGLSRTMLALKQAVHGYIAAQLLTKEETECVDNLFRIMDMKGQGSIDMDDLRIFYRDVLNQDMSEEQLTDIFDRVDADQSGSISYSEFLVSALPPEVLYRNNRLATAFKKIDVDGNGTIDREELTKLMSLFDSTLEDDELDMIMEIADRNQDGGIDPEEFEYVMTTAEFDDAIDDTDFVTPIRVKDRVIGKAFLTDLLVSAERNPGLHAQVSEELRVLVTKMKAGVNALLEKFGPNVMKPIYASQKITPEKPLRHVEITPRTPKEEQLSPSMMVTPKRKSTVHQNLAKFQTLIAKNEKNGLSSVPFHTPTKPERRVRPVRNHRTLSQSDIKTGKGSIEKASARRMPKGGSTHNTSRD